VENITVSVPDEVYRAARIRAAERGNSASAPVGEFLRSLSERAAEFARLEAQQRHTLLRVRTAASRGVGAKPWERTGSRVHHSSSRAPRKPLPSMPAFTALRT
jgi:plasmid stability protein